MTELSYGKPCIRFSTGALHATTLPPKWKGDRIWLVALKGEVRWEDDKCGALCREIIGECT